MAAAAPAGSARPRGAAPLALLGLGLLVAAATLAAGAGHLGYDASYAVLWGQELAHGHLPALTAPLAPTPHPLATATATLLAPLGDHAAAEVFLVLIALSSGFTVAGAARLAGAVGGWPAAAIAAVVLATRTSLLQETWRGSIDIPALGCVLWAACLLTGAQPRFRRALLWLVPAGLLRPEDWALALAVAATGVALAEPHGAPAITRGWATPARRRAAAGLVPLALAAPVSWALWDLLFTGDPLFSFHGTRALADELDRPRTATIAPLLAGPYVRVVLGLGVAGAGVGGLVLLARRRPRDAAVPVALIGLALATFVILGVAGLPLLARYLLVPCAGLIVCAGAVAADVRRAPLPAALVALALIGSLPATVHDVRLGRRDGVSRRATAASLRRLLDGAAFRTARTRCGPLEVASFRLVPDVARIAAADPRRILQATGRGLLILPASGRAATQLQAATDTVAPLLAPAAGTRLLTPRRADWALAGRC